MTKNELKELVKQHFNLVEANVEKFDKAELEDGSEVSNQKAGKFELGQVLFIKDDKGNFVEAPEGEHISKSGIQFILDKDSKITGLKYPDAKGEGSADLAEEDMDPQDKDMIKKGDQANEGAFKSDEDKMDARTDAEEEGYLDGIKDEKADLIKDGGFSLEDVVEVMKEVVEAKVEELKDKMKSMDDKMKSMEDKMSAFSSEPAADKTIPAIKFSKAEGSTKADKRYNLMLKRMANKK
tara:strand:- start:456 stop:1169 length:714 start_codon:yes stop_codon:yes gene_type:complete